MGESELNLKEHILLELVIAALNSGDLEEAAKKLGKDGVAACLSVLLKAQNETVLDTYIRTSCEHVAVEDLIQ